MVVLADAAQLADLLARAEYCADDLLVVPLQPVELQARMRMAFGRVQARHQRRVQARQLEDLTRRQREFLSVVSHEIRTPLSAIMSSANILRRYGRERPDSVEKFSTVIQQEGRRLTRLINNLLDLAKIEAGEVEWHLLPTPLGEVLDLLRDSFAALVGERRLELAVEAPGVPGEVVAGSRQDHPGARQPALQRGQALTGRLHRDPPVPAPRGRWRAVRGRGPGLGDPRG